jgi:hypothetical protein
MGSVSLFVTTLLASVVFCTVGLLHWGACSVFGVRWVCVCLFVCLSVLIFYFFNFVSFFYLNDLRYDVLKEYSRIGIPDSSWRITGIQHRLDGYNTYLF